MSIEKRQTEAIAAMPTSLGKLPRDEVPLIGFDIVGIVALRALISSSEPSPAKCEQEFEALDLPDSINSSMRSRGGLVMIMGKGGVGKTTIASAVAVGLGETRPRCSPQHHGSRPLISLSSLTARCQI